MAVGRSRPATAKEAGELWECNAAAYDAALAAKVDRVSGLVRSALGTAYEEPESFEVKASPKSHFRQRANFRVVIEEGTVYFVMFAADATTVPLRCDRFPRGSVRLNQLMTVTRDVLNRNADLRRSLIEVRIQTTKCDGGGSFVLLCYSRGLVQEKWTPAAEELRSAAGEDVVVVGRSRRLRLFVGAERPAIFETLHVDGRALVYEQVEGEFSQPNAAVCESMLSWAARATANSTDHDLLELYCGNGNFTVALAPNFRQVLATEMSKNNVLCARANAARNSCANVKVARLTAAEMGTALSPTGRDFNRLHQARVDLDDYDLGTLLVDPPRAGLDVDAAALAATFRRILYVSCNPDTFSRDLRRLRKTHRLTHLAVFDQFAYTDHVECGAVLTRRSQPLDDEDDVLEDAEQRQQQLYASSSSDNSKKRKNKRANAKRSPPAERPRENKRRRLGCCLM